jgi:folylpolyglutamate synthase/dihydropteroate synthase
VKDHIAEGMSAAVWPARMQKVDGLPLVVDVTHTAAGMRSFAEDIQRVYGRTVTVFGLLDDKDLTHIAESVAEMSDTVIVTHPDSDRALPCSHIADAVREHMSDVIVIPCVGDAIEEALRIAGGRTVAVTGSFAMAESAFLWLGNKGRAHISHL